MRKAEGGQYEGEFSDSRRHGAGVETFGPSNVSRRHGAGVETFGPSNVRRRRPCYFNLIVTID